MKKPERKELEWVLNGQRLLVQQPVSLEARAKAQQAYEQIQRSNREREEESIRHWEARQAEERAKIVKVSLRIGVFFDGTGNNASNTAGGVLCGAQHPIAPADLDAACQPYMSDPESSYGNDLSNIAKLHDLYFAPDDLQGEGTSRSAYRKVYVEGIGTKAGKADSMLGSGAGRGETGVEGKVWDAFQRIARVTQVLIKENPNCEITNLNFDIFGFSRGAAVARHFANEVMRGQQGPMHEVIGRRGFSETFAAEYARNVRVRFIGLFDTVASVAGLANLGNIRSAAAPGIKLYLSPRRFPAVVHLVARDEHRANFALNSAAPDHREIPLPGAHSDVGGGYLPEAQECVLVSPMQAQTVKSRVDVRSTTIYREAEQARARWIAQGWPAEFLEVVTPAPQLLPVDPQDRMAPRRKRVYAGVQLKRPVRGELSRVYLRVMYALAEQQGVRFNPIDENDPDIVLPAELQPLSERFKAGDYSTSPAEEALLRRCYIHCSAHWNPPKRLLGNVTRTGLLLYINAPTADAVRVIHPHVPEWKLS